MARAMPPSDRVERLLAALTVEEKAALTAGVDLWSLPGVPRLGIPAVAMTDGPNGARGTTLPGPDATPTTCVPCGSALGATWDPELVGEVGALVAREARAKGCRVLLAPTVNIPRSPLAGRTFECYSEDPLLSGRLAAAFVRGAQAEGVVTTVKHLVANDAEFERYTMSSTVDERTLRELYLVPFELAVAEGGALGLMTGYNRLNGRWCSEDADLLSGIVRDEWGFEGVVVTDWFAVASTVDSSAAGVDVEMPGPGRAFGPQLAEAVRRGDVSADVLDGQVRRLLGTLERVGALDDAEPPPRPAPETRAALSRRAAVEGMVLLKNVDVLPLPAALRSLAVIGHHATSPTIMGGGSAAVEPGHRTSPLEALRRALGADVEVRHQPGVDLDAVSATDGGTADAEALRRAAAAAREAEAAVVIVGTTARWESEGFDRAELRLPGPQDELVHHVAAANPRTVVVVNAGAPVAMPWVDEVAAVLQVWFGGEEMAGALAAVLTGEEEPGGRLPITVPACIEHTPAFGNFPAGGLSGRRDEVLYGEGLLVGYRWYESRRLPTTFPFGHGLGYTTFELGPPQLSSAQFREGDVLTVTVPVANRGSRAGSEVIQCYVAPPPGPVFRPRRELRAFGRIRLGPGEGSALELRLDRRAFAVWDPGAGGVAERRGRLPIPSLSPLDPSMPERPGWRVLPGRYEVQVGRSSSDTRGAGTVDVVE